MRIRLTVHRPDLGKAPGDEVEFEAERALRLIEAGQAEAVARVAEASVTETTEVAALPPAKKPKRS